MVNCRVADPGLNPAPDKVLLKHSSSVFSLLASISLDFGVFLPNFCNFLHNLSKSMIRLLPPLACAVCGKKISLPNSFSAPGAV